MTVLVLFVSVTDPGTNLPSLLFMMGLSSCERVVDHPSQSVISRDEFCPPFPPPAFFWSERITYIF